MLYTFSEKYALRRCIQADGSCRLSHVTSTCRVVYCEVTAKRHIRGTAIRNKIAHTYAVRYLDRHVQLATAPLHLLSTPASIGVPKNGSVFIVYLLWIISYLMLAGGSMLGTYSRTTYPIPTTVTSAPAVYLHQLLPMMMQPTKM